MRGRERRDGETVRVEEWEKGGRDSERREKRGREQNEREKRERQSERGDIEDERRDGD